MSVENQVGELAKILTQGFFGLVGLAFTVRAVVRAFYPRGK
jgi:hypothetical protein